MKTICIRCAAMFTKRSKDYPYPDNAPAWPWKYCDTCIAMQKPLLRIVEVTKNDR